MPGKVSLVIGVFLDVTMVESEGVAPEARQARSLYIYGLPNGAHGSDLSFGLGHYCCLHGESGPLEQTQAWTSQVQGSFQTRGPRRVKWLRAAYLRPVAKYVLCGNRSSSVGVCWWVSRDPPTSEKLFTKVGCKVGGLSICKGSRHRRSPR